MLHKAMAIRIQSPGLGLVILAAVAAGGCQSSPVAPTSPLVTPTASAPAVANFAGEWRVVYHVESCLGRYCFISGINRDATLDIRLVQIGDRVTGLVGTADVEGIVAPDGSLSLRGFAPAPPIETAASFELRQFEVRLDTERGLAGHLDYAALISGEYSSYSTGAAGPIVSATRRPLDTTSFNGSWRGYYALAACTPASCPYDDAEISLEDAGGTVTGTVSVWPHRIPVSGHASGQRAELRGQLPWGRNATAEAVVRVQRSATGRLTGAVEVNASNGQSVTYTLLDVTPQPSIE